MYLCKNLKTYDMRQFITETVPDYSLLDNHTGEIREFRRTRVVDVDEFIMFFFASIPELCKLEGLQLKILMCCWKNSSYNNVETEGNLVYNNRLLKDYVRECGINASDTTIDVCIHKLAEKGILMKKCRGVYMLNPEYFFRGRLAKKSRLELKVMTQGN